MSLTFSHEPAAWLGLLRVAIYLGAVFGLELSNAQEGAIVLFVEALFGVIQRQSVTPNAKLSDATVEAAKHVPPDDPA